MVFGNPKRYKIHFNSMDIDEVTDYEYLTDYKYLTLLARQGYLIKIQWRRPRSDQA